MESYLLTTPIHEETGNRLRFMSEKNERTEVRWLGKGIELGEVIAGSE